MTFGATGEQHGSATREGGNTSSKEDAMRSFSPRWRSLER